MWFVWLLAILGGITALVIIHELGHFLFGKMAKMNVAEFSIGFGPAIFQKKFKETTFSIRIIPMGGYVAVLSDKIKQQIQNIQNSKIEDETQWEILKKQALPFDIEHDYDADTTITYEEVKPPKKALFLVGGVFFNYLISVIILWFIYGIDGMPTPKDELRVVDDLAFCHQRHFIVSGNRVYCDPIDIDNPPSGVTNEGDRFIPFVLSNNTWTPREDLSFLKKGAVINKIGYRNDILPDDAYPDNTYIKGNDWVVPAGITPDESKWIINESFRNMPSFYKRVWDEIARVIDDANIQDSIDKNSMSESAYYLVVEATPFGSLTSETYLVPMAIWSRTPGSLFNPIFPNWNLNEINTRVGRVVEYKKMGAGEVIGRGLIDPFIYSIEMFKLIDQNVSNTTKTDFFGKKLVEESGANNYTSYFTGPTGAFFLGVFFSTNLMLFNIFPFPPLDGYKVCEVGYEVATKKRVSEKQEKILKILGYIFLGILFILLLFA